MLRVCSAPGCSTVGISLLCIAHEPKPTQTFVRGRPWPPQAPDLAQALRDALPAVAAVPAEALRRPDALPVAPV